MPKKIAFLLLVSIMVGLLFPLVSFAYPFQFFEDNSKPKGIYNEGDTISGVGVICYEGLVPCGKKLKYILGAGVTEEACRTSTTYTKKIVHCQLCHAFVMIGDIINYIFVDIIPWLAIFMFVVGGIMFYFGGAKPELRGKAKTLMKSVAIGLGLAYGSFLIVGLFLTILGATNVGPVRDVWKNDSIFSINCPIRINENLKAP